MRFHWIMYLFGAFLLLTGIRLLLQREIEPHPEHNPLFRLFTRLVPSAPEYHGSRFTVRVDGRTFVTPLLLVLVLIEITDLVFAVDSIPAIFAVTSDPFIVYTSNIFAILGLRALYFLLAGAMDRFAYLKVGLSFVLDVRRHQDGDRRPLQDPHRPLARRHRRASSASPCSPRGCASGPRRPNPWRAPRVSPALRAPLGGCYERPWLGVWPRASGAWRCCWPRCPVRRPRCSSAMRG